MSTSGTGSSELYFQTIHLVSVSYTRQPDSVESQTSKNVRVRPINVKVWINYANFDALYY